MQPLQLHGVPGVRSPDQRHQPLNASISSQNPKNTQYEFLPVVLLLQRATIAVHDGKILVKTEIVKAIITADKAVLIKGR
jgi:hypothetical protein